MRYLIFGGSGFIGTHLVHLLYSNTPSAQIINLDLVENNHGGKSIYQYCDVREPIDIKQRLSQEDIIFNFAAIHRTPGHPDASYFETNITGAENITAFAEKQGVRSIVFTSSIAPYGASESLKKETSLPMPDTPYGISKLIAEKIHQVWHAKDSENRFLLIVRPGVVFGKGENGNFSRLYTSLLSRKFIYPGRKDTIKACIYVKDLVRFMLFILEQCQTGIQIYNCTYEPAFTIEQICKAMIQTMDRKQRILIIPPSILLGVAGAITLLGGKSLGIHPARVRKLMVSTNISGLKMKATGYPFRFSLPEAIRDWKTDEKTGFS